MCDAAIPTILHVCVVHVGNLLVRIWPICLLVEAVADLAKPAVQELARSGAERLERALGWVLPRLIFA